MARRLYSWGINNQYVTGRGGSYSGASTTTVPTSASTTIWFKSIGGSHAYNGIAIDENDDLYSWGADNSNGFNYSGNSSHVHVPTLLTGGTWSYVSTDGDNVQYAIDSSGNLFNWGTNIMPLIADPWVIRSLKPIPFGLGKVWRQVEGGADGYGGITTNGKLYAWGREWDFQLGNNNDTGIVSTEVQIGSDTDWLQLSIGSGYGMAIKTNGTLWGWGRNAYYNLGQNSSTTPRQVPTQTGSDTNWAQVSVDTDGGAAIKTNGTLWTWGRANYYQTGQNSTTTVQVPTQVGTDTNWKKVIRGQETLIALKTDGTIWTWGRAQYYQTAQNSTTTVQVPTQVGTDQNWSDIYMAQNNGFALKDTSPVTITTTAPTHATMKTENSGGNVLSNGGFTITAAGVCWNTTGSPTIANPHTHDSTAIGIFSSTLTGLTQNVLYYVRAYVTNTSGTTYGNEYNFTIDFVAPVLTGYIDGVCAELSWTDTQNAEHEHYEIWKTTGNDYPKTDLLAVWKLDETTRPFTDSYRGWNRYPDYYGNGGYNASGYPNANGKLKGCFWNNTRNFHNAIPLGFWTNNVITGNYYNSFSINAWIKRDNTGIDAIASCMKTNVHDHPYNGWAFFIDSSNRLGFQIINTLDVDSTYTAIDIRTTKTITDTNWHMVTFTYGGRGNIYVTDAQPKLYIDGTGCTINYITYNLRGAEWNNGAYAAIGAMTAENLISGSRNTSHYEFRGYIDEVALWIPTPYSGYPNGGQDKQLPASSITKLWNNGNALRYMDCTSANALLTTVNYPTQSYEDCAITSGCTYTYCVKSKLDSYTPTLTSTCSNIITLEIGGATGVSGLTATNIVATGCTLTWVNTAIIASNVLYNHVQVSLDGNTWQTLASLPSGSTTYHVIGLTPNTHYFLRILTEDIYHNLISSSVVEILTADPTPINLDAAYILYTTNAWSSWEIPYVYGTEIIVQLRISGDTAWTTITVLSPEETGYVFYHLSFGTNYQFRVILSGDKGDFPSELFNFSTPVILIPTLITRPISGITLSMASSGGIITSDGGSFVTEKGICWYTSANPTVLNFHTMDGSGTTTYTSLMLGLVPNTQYHVRAYAINIAGIGYGQDLYFTTKGQYCDTYLRFEDNLLYDLEVPDFEINFALNDIKNFNEAKTSYTVPIKIPYTPHSAEIFGLLFNVNNLSQATDIKIDCKLIYKDKTIINGYCFVDYVTFSYIYVIVARADLNIYESIKDLTLSQLQFTGSTYTYHNNNNFNIRNSETSYVKENNMFHYSSDTADYHFINIDWKGYANLPVSGSQEWLQTSKCLSASNRLSPVIRVKTIFDKLLSSQGYTYSASTAFLDKLDGLFMSTNVPINNYCVDGVSKFLFSAIWTDSDFLTFGHTGTSLTYLKPKEVSGSSKAYNQVATRTFSPIGNRGMMPMYPFTLYDNEYNFNMNVNASSTGDGSIKFYLHKWFSTTAYKDDDPDGQQDIPIGTISFVGATPTQVYNLTTTVTPVIEEVFSTKILVHNINDGGYFLRVVHENDLTEMTWTPPNYPNLTITCKNWLYDTGHTFTLSNLLSNTYTQYQFLNDLLNMFNIYTYVSETNKKHLNFLTYQDFYNNVVLDWSDKFTTENLEIYDTAQQLNDKYTIAFADNSDKMGKSFKDKSNMTLNEKVVINPAQLSINNTNVIKTTAAQAILCGDLLLPSTNYVSAYNYIPNNYYICSAIGEENSKIMFGYINKFNLGITSQKYDSSQIDVYRGGWLNLIWTDDGAIYLYSLTNKILGMAKGVNNYLTLSPFRLTGETILGTTATVQTSKGSNINDIRNASTFALLYDSENQYLNNALQDDPVLKQLTGTGITNNNIYNNFWIADVESKIFTNQKFLKAYLKLYPNDVKIENFRNRIWIDNEKLGGAYYRINKIVFPSNEQKLSYAELITDLNYVSSYPAIETLTRYSYNYLDGTTSLSNQPSTGETTPTGTTLNLADIGDYYMYPVVVMGANEAAGKTFHCNITWSVYSSCQVRNIGDPNEATTTLYYTDDGGLNWHTIATAYSEITGNNLIASDSHTGVTTLTGQVNPANWQFRCDWEYQERRDPRNGGFTLWLTHAGTNSVACRIICSDYAQGNGDDYTPVLSCTF